MDNEDKLEKRARQFEASNARRDAALLMDAATELREFRDRAIDDLVENKVAMPEIDLLTQKIEEYNEKQHLEGVHKILWNKIYRDYKELLE